MNVSANIERHTMKKIHELMDKPSKWTRFALGRDGRSRKLGYKELDQAVRCCAIGWIYKVYGDGKRGERVKEKVRKLLNLYWITEWNDRATFQEVHSVFKELGL